MHKRRRFAVGDRLKSIFNDYVKSQVVTNWKLSANGLCFRFFLLLLMSFLLMAIKLDFESFKSISRTEGTQRKSWKCNCNLKCCLKSQVCSHVLENYLHNCIFCILVEVSVTRNKTYLFMWYCGNYLMLCRLK